MYTVTFDRVMNGMLVEVVPAPVVDVVPVEFPVEDEELVPEVRSPPVVTLVLMEVVVEVEVEEVMSYSPEVLWSVVVELLSPEVLSEGAPVVV